MWNLHPGGGLVGDGISPSSFLRLAAIVRVQRRDRREQRLGVGVARVGKQVRGWGGFDEAAQIHHRHMVADMGDDAQVVADEQECQPHLFLNAFSRFSTSAWIDTSSAATLSSATMNFGPDTSARAIEMRCRCPPENACGKAAQVFQVQPAFRGDLAHPLIGFSRGIWSAHDLQRFGDDVAHGHAWAEGRIGVLKDQLRAFAVILSALPRFQRGFVLNLAVIDTSPCPG